MREHISVPTIPGVKERVKIKREAKHKEDPGWLEKMLEECRGRGTRLGWVFFLEGGGVRGVFEREDADRGSEAYEGGGFEDGGGWQWGEGVCR